MLFLIYSCQTLIAYNFVHSSCGDSAVNGYCTKGVHFSAIGGSAFCNVDRLGVPKQTLGEIPLDFGIVMEDKPSQLSCKLEPTSCCRYIIKMQKKCLL